MHATGTASILDRPPPAGDAAPARILVAGASGGIGAAFCRACVERFPGASLLRMARDISRLPALPAQTTDVTVDIGDETSIREAVAELDADPPIDWVFVATGWLHDNGSGPEKTYKMLEAERLMHAYRINAVGPALLVKHLIPYLDRATGGKIGVLSARVGSISDNRLGGWHAYRASKAALNMLIKNYAIELGRGHGGPIIVGLQPGTTDTPLSAPFQRNLPASQLQTPDYTAGQMVRLMQNLRVEDSGGLFDFLGIEFAP